MNSCSRTTRRRKACSVRAKQQAFALTEVVQRRAHFSYTDSAGMQNANNDLNDKLRQRLEQAEPNAPAPVSNCVSIKPSSPSTAGCWPR